MIGQRVFGPEDVRVAQTLDYLGVVLADRGQLRRMRDERLEEALRDTPKSPRALSTRMLRSRLAELGRVYQDQGQNQRAEPIHREALAIRRKVLGENHRETAVSQSDLASVLRLNGDLDGAETLLKECLETNRRTRGEDHPNTSTTLHDLALIAAMRGEYPVG